MKRKSLLLFRMALIFTLVLTACGGPSQETEAPTQHDSEAVASTSTPIQEPTATANPNTVTAEVDTDGGTITSIDGLVEFIVPEGSVTEPMTVNLTLIDDVDDDPRFVTPAYDIQVEGGPEDYGWLPMLSFPGAADLEESQSLVFATNLTIEGDFEAEGDAAGGIQYWVPLKHSWAVEGRPMLLPMWHFSPYRVFNVEIGPVCEPTDEMLEPPPPLEEYYYVGRVVVINDVYNEVFSTLPPDYEETHNGKVRGFRFVDEASGCDILVLHWYRPDGAAPTPTPDPGGGGWPPPPPPALNINPPQEPCMVYLGYKVFFRFQEIFDNVDRDKLFWGEAVWPFDFQLSNEIQPPGFEVLYIYGSKNCDDWDECTEDWCNPMTGECEYQEIYDCVPAECECTEDCVVSSEGCTWPDANECSGLHSACEYEGIHPPYKDGQTCCWGSCCITIRCP